MSWVLVLIVVDDAVVDVFFCSICIHLCIYSSPFLSIQPNWHDPPPSFLSSLCLLCCSVQFSVRLSLFFSVTLCARSRSPIRCIHIPPIFPSLPFPRPSSALEPSNTDFRFFVFAFFRRLSLSSLLFLASSSFSVPPLLFIFSHFLHFFFLLLLPLPTFVYTPYLLHWPWLSCVVEGSFLTPFLQLDLLPSCLCTSLSHSLSFCLCAAPIIIVCTFAPLPVDVCVSRPCGWLCARVFFICECCESSAHLFCSSPLFTTKKRREKQQEEYQQQQLAAIATTTSTHNTRCFSIRPKEKKTRFAKRAPFLFSFSSSLPSSLLPHPSTPLIS